jgi:hypothetical protein
VGRKHERARDESEPVRAGRGIVNRPGRAKADGSREATSARRFVFVFPFELATELEKRAHDTRKSLTDCAAEALAEQWGIVLEAAS